MYFSNYIVGMMLDNNCTVVGTTHFTHNYYYRSVKNFYNRYIWINTFSVTDTI